MPALPLSDAQLAEAAKLKSLFKEWQRARKEAGLPFSQEAVSESLGFGQSAFSQYLNGGIPLNVGAAVKFANLLGVTLGDFSPSLVDQAETFAEAIGAHLDEPISLAGMPVTDDLDYALEHAAIDLVEVHLQAGIDGFETVPLSEDGGKHYIPRHWMEKNGFTPSMLRATKCKGKSMEPMMYEGDIIVINVTDTTRKDGRVFAVNYNGQAVIKRLKYERREWYLTSENPEFRPEPCRGADCKVIGRVVRFDPKNFDDRL